MSPQERFTIAHFMREEWNDFPTFARAGMEFLGYDITWMQSDIAQYMQEGPRLRMVMAQRGEAKSTLAALYAVWRIVQDPSTVILVVSGGEQQASEVANLIIRLIQTWDLLEYLRPDTRSGDRNSRVEFDVHWMLKGLNKSPSVACVGITSTLQGKRAHVLIPDDVETTKNSLTALQRSQLLRLTQEFTSINTDGDILYLGTPQTKDSIYNTLEGRGFDIRIWPGRFPTSEEQLRYGSRLAPAIREKLTDDPGLTRGGGIDGTRGKPTDPDRFNEDALVEKELDQGPEGFQLQYMLDTSLMDALRQQLKLSDLVVANFDWQQLPEVIVYQASPVNQVELPSTFPVPATKMYHPLGLQNVQISPPKDTLMFIDPAGGGSDELAFAIGARHGAYIHAFDVGGLRGGLTDDNGQTLLELIKEFNVKTVVVESNMGHGLFELSLRGILERADIKDVGVVGEYSTGQKERRIIDSLVGAMQRHRLVIHPRVLESDLKYNLQHSADKRKQYSLWYQLATITTDRASLVHDDRIEALAGMVRRFKVALAMDENKAAEQRALAEAREFMQNPMGYHDPALIPHRHRPQVGIRAVMARRRGNR